MTHAWLASHAPLAGLILFVSLAIGIVIHTFLPAKRATFDAAATIPFQED